MRFYTRVPVNASRIPDVDFKGQALMNAGDWLITDATGQAAMIQNPEFVEGYRPSAADDARAAYKLAKAELPKDPDSAANEDGAEGSGGLE